jgi:hypothetical protein
MTCKNALLIKKCFDWWYDFGTIYIQNRSILFNYFQLEVWTKFKFYAGFIEFCAKTKIDNSAFAMQRSGVSNSIIWQAF